MIQLNWRLNLTTPASFGIPNISKPSELCLSHRVKCFKLGETLTTGELKGEERPLEAIWPGTYHWTSQSLVPCPNGSQSHLWIVVILKCYLWLTSWVTGVWGGAPQPLHLQGCQLILSHPLLGVQHRSLLGSYCDNVPTARVRQIHLLIRDFPRPRACSSSATVTHVLCGLFLQEARWATWKASECHHTILFCL